MIMVELEADHHSLKAHKMAFNKVIRDCLALLTCNDDKRIEKALSSYSSKEINFDWIPSLSSTEGKAYLEFVSNAHAKSDLTTAGAKVISKIVDDDIKMFGLKNADIDVRNCRKILREVFSYDSFRDGRPLLVKDGRITWGKEWSSEWDAFRFLQSLNVSICPYCNGETIYAVEIKKTSGGSRVKLVRSALDHFYCRKYFPYLGLSLYNLVPSCTRCNSSLKGRRVMRPAKIIHPYLDASTEYAKFVLKDGDIGNISEASPIGSFHLGIEYDTKGDRKKALCAKYTLEDVFKTDTVYNQIYFREAAAVIYKARKFSMSEISFLKRRYVNFDPDMLVFGCSLQKNASQYRLAKMTTDLVEFVRTRQNLSVANR